MTQPTIGSFFGGGGKSVSWKDKPLGTTVTGTIKVVHPPEQSTDPIDGSPQINKRTGRPKMQLRIELATSERDPQDPDDDGSRNLYVGGWMQGAIGDALRKVGKQEPEIGGTLTVTLTERQPNDVPALAPINKFVASYIPAPVTAGYFQQPAQQATPVAPAQPQYAAPVQPVPPQPVYVPPAVQVAEPEPARPPQIAEGAWAAMPLDVKKSVAATMAAMPGSVQWPGAPPF